MRVWMVDEARGQPVLRGEGSRKEEAVLAHERILISRRVVRVGGMEEFVGYDAPLALRSSVSNVAFRDQVDTRGGDYGAS